MPIQALTEEIKQVKEVLKQLEEELFTQQESCTHTFVKLENYQQCKVCQKSEPLYY